jgi:hypothetical protein
MKIYSSIILSVIFALFGSGCVSAPPAAKSGVELQSYQAREFETSKRAAFSATMSVFQDLGFIIDDGDFDTGLITATGPMLREQMDAGDLFAQLFTGVDTRVATQRRATAFVEKMPSGLVRIRLNFVDNMAMIQGTPHSAAVEDPAFYQATFEQIDKAIFVRSATT